MANQNRGVEWLIQSPCKLRQQFQPKRPDQPVTVHVITGKKAIICCSGDVNCPLLTYTSERLLPAMNCETSHFLDNRNEKSSNA